MVKFTKKNKRKNKKLMPERNENYMNKIKKLCGFCINEWHLTTMLLPYISKEIENNYKMITILENSIEENIKTLNTISEKIDSVPNSLETQVNIMKQQLKDIT